MYKKKNTQVQVPAALQVLTEDELAACVGGYGQSDLFSHGYENAGSGIGFGDDGWPIIPQK